MVTEYLRKRNILDFGRLIGKDGAEEEIRKI